MKYNELEITWGGQQVLFITRGRSKPFTAEEATDYLRARTMAIAKTAGDAMPMVELSDIQKLEFDKARQEGYEKDAYTMPVAKTDPEGREEFRIPDDKMRKHIFRKDIAMGLDFAARKYGVSQEAIQNEVMRLAKQETRRA